MHDLTSNDFDCIYFVNYTIYCGESFVDISETFQQI